MISKILFIIGKQLVTIGFSLLFNYVDKNNDGNLSREEIESFISETRKLISKLKNKNMK